jgi:hypothetical protein
VREREEIFLISSQRFYTAAALDFHLCCFIFSGCLIFNQTESCGVEAAAKKITERKRENVPQIQPYIYIFLRLCRAWRKIITINKKGSFFALWNIRAHNNKNGK